MKNIHLIGLSAVFLFVSRCALADCRGEIIDLTSGPHGTIEVRAQFYTGDNLGGWVKEGAVDRKLFRPDVFVGKNKTARMGIITKYLDDRCQQIIISKYQKIKGHPKDEADAKISAQIIGEMTAYLNEIKTLNVTRKTVPIKVDSDGDRKYDEEWNIETDGNKAVTAIVPVAIQ